MIIYDQVTFDTSLVDSAKNKHATINMIILGYSDNKFDIVVKTNFVFATDNQESHWIQVVISP